MIFTKVPQYQLAGMRKANDSPYTLVKRVANLGFNISVTARLDLIVRQEENQDTPEIRNR